MSEKENNINRISKSNGWTAVYILTAVLMLCAFIIDSRIFQLFFDTDFSFVKFSWDTFFGYLFDKIYLKIPCLLFVLYVFIFRKKAFGSLVFPIIYTIKFAALIRAIISDITFTFKFANEYPNFAISDNSLGLPIVSFIMDIVLAAGCVVLAIAAVKGFPNKPVLIVITILFCIPNLYGLINYILFNTKTGINPFSTVSGYCDYLLPVLLYVTMMIIGLRKDYTSVADAFKRAKDVPKRNRKFEKELKEYEDILDDLKFQLDSGVISQKNYDELVKDVNADIEDLRNKYQ